MIAPAPSFPRIAPVAAPRAAIPAGLPERRMGTTTLLLMPALTIAAVAPNPSLTIAAMLSLWLIIRLLWRAGHPPALLLVCGLQWAQGAMMTLEANVRGVELWTLLYARSGEAATYLTLAWVTSVAIGAWLVTRKLSLEAVASTMGVPIAMERLLAVYAAWTVTVQVMSQVESQSMLQLVGAFAFMRWGIVFAIFAYGWRMPAWRPIIVAVLFFEVASGFLTFFSHFKMPLFLFAIALLTSGYRPTFRAWVGMTLVAAMTLYLGVLWSAIKMDYREKISGGRGHQSQLVQQSVGERAESFVDVVGTVDEAILAQGFEKLTRRLAYIEYFAYVIDYVPAVRDHERGALWGAAVSHVLMPRILFPDKPILPDETALTERYTGLELGSGSGTSISIGIPGEAYIDFGELGVVGLGMLFGMVLGLAYRFFITQRRYGVAMQGMAVALCLGFSTIETGAVKSLGAMLSFVIVAGVGCRILFPRLVPWLSLPYTSTRRR